MVVGNPLLNMMRTNSNLDAVMEYSETKSEEPLDDTHEINDDYEDVEAQRTVFNTASDLNPTINSAKYDKSSFSPFIALIKRVYKHWLFQEILISGNMPLGLLYCKKYLRTPHGLILSIIQIILRGISQVFLCNNPITGVFICIGLALTSWELLFYALLGTACGTLGAYLIATADIDEVMSGLCGYDGALTGCAVSVFFAPFPGRWALAAAMATIAGFLHVSCYSLTRVAGLPPLTFAFNVVGLALLHSSNSGTAHIASLSSSAPLTPSSWGEMSGAFMLDAAFRGVGQFMFVDTTLGGVMVVLGIGVASRPAAVAVLVGAIVSSLSAYYAIVVDVADRINIRKGLFGYNAAGTCAVMAGGAFYMSTLPSLIVGALGAGLSSLVLAFFRALLKPLPVFTVPFIVSAWLMMLSKSRWLLLRPPAGEIEAPVVSAGAVAGTSTPPPSPVKGITKTPSNVALRGRLATIRQPWSRSTKKIYSM